MASLIVLARRAAREPLVALAVLMAAQGGFGLWAAIGQRSVDFPVYLFAATLAGRGESMYVVPPGRWADLAQELGVGNFTDPYLYPPLTAGVVRLIGWLPYPAPLVLWNLVSVLAIVASGCLMARACRGRWLDAGTFWLLAAYFPIYTTLFAGQVNTFVALAVAVFVWGTAVGRRGVAGLGLAFSVMIKPLSIALVALPVWRRDGWAMVATAVGVVVATGVGVLLAGPFATIDYARNANVSTMGQTERGISLAAWPPVQSLFSLLGRIFTVHEYGPNLVDAPEVGRVVGVVVAAALVGGVAVVTFDRRRGGLRAETVALETGLILITTNLIWPTTWFHHLAVSVLAYLAIWYHARAGWERGAVVLILALLAIHGAAWRQLVALGQTWALSFGVYCLLAGYLLIMVQLRRAARSSSDGAPTSMGQ